jgi:hypothetical protein
MNKLILSLSKDLIRDSLKRAAKLWNQEIALCAKPVGITMEWCIDNTVSP